MNTNTVDLLFALLRSAIRGNKLQESEKKLLSKDAMQELFVLSKKHDIAHLYATGLNINGLTEETDEKIKNEIISAIYRYTQLNYEYVKLCDALENAHIPFIPLKGSVIRKWYPEPWMRTSCDIDILIHHEHLKQAVEYLVNTLEYKADGQGQHDVSLFTKGGKHIELHFDLVEDGRANDASTVLRNVWENVSLKSGKKYWYEMTDEFFYFYHVAHMAKHFEVGGCGIRPFIDLWILDHIEGFDINKRDALLRNGGLFKFAIVIRNLSKCWLEGYNIDELSFQMQDFILSGGVYGSSKNRVSLQQTKNGGRIGYIFSRVFVSYNKLKRYYPVLEKHRWLMPIMQIKRWGMLFRPDVARMAKNELSANNNIEKSTAEEMNKFLNKIGL